MITDQHPDFNSEQPQTQAMAVMPMYQSHKKVWALKIKAVGYKGEDVRLEFENEGFAPRVVCVENKPKPEAGWYLVQYEGGYISFSPAKEFEEGYTLISGKRPSIAELEAILNSEEERPITILPDGSITA